MNLAENIKLYRRGSNMTQEQLAEAVGVTVGAVSKWESGATVPDLSTLMALAELFQISLDALLGFRLKGESGDTMADAIKACTGERDWEKGRRQVEAALQRFPNHFGVVHRSAEFYEMMGLGTGTEEDRHCSGDLRRAIDLYERACTLLEQNRDPQIGYRTLQMHISQCWQWMGESEKALAVLRANNEGGVYDDLVGVILMNLKRWDEATRVLSESMLDSIGRLERSAMGLWNCLSEGLGQHREALELQAWMAHLYEGLYPQGGCYLYKINAALYAGCAIMAFRLGELSCAADYFRKAKALAQCFDANPTYEMAQMRFYHGRSATAHDDFGTTAMDGIRKTLERQDGSEREALVALWEQVSAE